MAAQVRVAAQVRRGCGGACRKEFTMLILECIFVTHNFGEFSFITHNKLIKILMKELLHPTHVTDLK